MIPLIKLGLIDDEQLQLDYLNQIIKGIPGFQISFSVTDPIEGFRLAKQKACDILITDIEMERLNGLIISEEMETLEMPVIICSAFKDYAIPGINLSVSGYLLKPVQILDLNRALLRASKKLMARKQRIVEESWDFVLLNEEGHFGYTKVSFDSIFCLEQIRNYTYFQAPPKVFKERSTISDWLNKLPPNMFIQIHKSFVVNFGKVDRILGNEVVLTNGKSIPVGRSFREDLFEVCRIG